VARCAHGALRKSRQSPRQSPGTRTLSAYTSDFPPIVGRSHGGEVGLSSPGFSESAGQGEHRPRRLVPCRAPCAHHPRGSNEISGATTRGGLLGPEQVLRDSSRAQTNPGPGHGEPLPEVDHQGVFEMPSRRPVFHDRRATPSNAGGPPAARPPRTRSRGSSPRATWPDDGNPAAPPVAPSASPPPEPPAGRTSSSPP
jgi:hypothetical protein